MLRFVILAILVFIAYRLLIGGLKGWRGVEKKAVPPISDTKVSDVLVEDPVCHTLVPRQQAIRLQHKGEIIYFCSEKCCNIFIQQGDEE